MNRTHLLTLLLSLALAGLVIESCKKKESCPTGFSGDNCEIEDLCVTRNVTCLNGGVCDDGTCDCPDGYLGTNCETIDLSKIQVLLSAGVTPGELFNKGIPVDSLYGKVFGGGLIINLDTAVGTALIARAQDETFSVKWGGHGTDITAIANLATIPAASMDLDGEANTTAITGQLGTNGGTDYAAKLCADLVADGFDDWYLPAEGELLLMLNKLGPVAFGGNGQMPDGFYWSSTERSPTGAWSVGFSGGNANSLTKDANYRCRCVRK